MAYIGNFPSSPGFSAVNFKMNTTTKRTTAASGRIIRATNSTTLWSGTLAFPVMSLTEFRPIQGFIAQTDGGLNEFDIVIPTVSVSQSSYASVLSATVDGAHTAGDETINISSNVPNQSILKAGDIVRFANHTKVYMVTSDINSDGSGDAVLNIKPGLVEALVDTESITTTNVPFRMILSNDVQEFSYRTDNRIAYEIDIEETI